MIKGYFGVPGSGKTTILAKCGIKEIKRLKKRYENIYTINFKLSGCIEIDWSDLAYYKMYNCLILIDEISTLADNREFKSFMKEHRDFFIMHRHLGIDIIWATQNYEKVDKTIREMTQELWYISRSVVPLLGQFTRAKKIYRQININEHTSELTLGYRFCNFLEGIFATNNELVFRKKYYKYFDSYDELMLKDRPVLTKNDKEPFPQSKFKKGMINLWKNFLMKTNQFYLKLKHS